MSSSVDGGTVARMPSHEYGYLRSATVVKPAGMESRQMPWNPSQPAIASQLTSCRAPAESVKRSTGRSVSSSATSVPETSNSILAPAASLACIRSLTISVWA
jgi:hypothetical protein